MGVSWLKTGEESKKMAQQQAAEAEKKKQEFGKMFRFWLKEKETCSLTFVDGDLDPQGFLTPPRFYEHNLFLNGSWGNTFVCPEKTDPNGGGKCPICAGGDKPQLVSLFTVIDHRGFTTKSNIHVPYSRKLYVATPKTFEILNKLAQKRQGLTGCTFDVTRTTDKAPRVGDLFDFTEKVPLEQAKTKWVRQYTDKDGKVQTVNEFTPADYDKEIIYRTSEELMKMGFGAPAGAPNVGGQPAGSNLPSAKPEEAKAEDYENHL